jgi:hypothetical protein
MLMGKSRLLIRASARPFNKVADAQRSRATNFNGPIDGDKGDSVEAAVERRGFVLMLLLLLSMLLLLLIMFLLFLLWFSLQFIGHILVDEDICSVLLFFSVGSPNIFNLE